ncbi:transcriptional regulator with XRE-family HTH domain [Streptacidiphilus sp. BW17]|uniref:helix-turn-helix domain-containing protein n=1 Tax=Streptacidiphilus sp. BW17 TaxID=3156274 RepID=UPI00351324AE
MGAPLGPIELPDWAWQSQEMREALRGRRIADVFRRAQQFGISQSRIAAATGMAQGRVNEIINGRRDVSRLDVYERIADGLAMPDDARHLLGLASDRARRSSGRAFDLAAFPEVVRVYASQASASDDIRRQARTASEIDLLAVRGLGLIGLNDSLLRPSITGTDARVRLRALLLDPTSPTITVRAKEIGESEQSLASGVLLAEARLKELAEICDVETYRYRLLPTWRLIRLDATLFLSAFDAGWEGHESATYKIMQTPHGPLYRGFRRMFDAMLADGERTH